MCVVRKGYTLIIQRYMTYDSTQGTRADVRFVQRRRRSRRDAANVR